MSTIHSSSSHSTSTDPGMRMVQKLESSFSCSTSTSTLEFCFQPRRFTKEKSKQHWILISTRCFNHHHHHHRRHYHSLLLCILLMVTRVLANRQDDSSNVVMDPLFSKRNSFIDSRRRGWEATTKQTTGTRAILSSSTSTNSPQLVDESSRKIRFRFWDRASPLLKFQREQKENTRSDIQSGARTSPHHHDTVSNTSSTQFDSHDTHSSHLQRLENRDVGLSTTTATTTGSILSTFAISLSQQVTPERLLRITFTGLQLGIALYLVKTIWTAVGDVLAELEQETSSNRLKEDHDLPYVQEEVVDSLSSHNTTTALPNRKRNTMTGRNSHSMQSTTTTSHLAMRLHAAGIPWSSTSTATTTSTRTVSSILKSLTRTEGQLLSNTLLSPVDFYEAGSIQVNSPPRIEQQEQQQVRNNQIMQMWNDIGGLEDVKESLLDLVFPMLFLKQQTTATRNDGTNMDIQQGRMYYGGLLNNPPGVLLYGPPGCGKTLLVRALAHSANARFLYITPSTLLRKYVGETNLHVRALFSVARKISPCIIFIDEMEGLFRERGGTSSSGGEEHEVSRELKTEFMQLWDGIMSGEQNEHILVVGATNRPFDVDAAFLRRMPRSFYVGLPDSSSRYKILQSMLSNVPLADDFDLERIAQSTEQYSPSDLKEVLRTAALHPLREARATMIQTTNSLGTNNTHIIPPLRPLTMSDVNKAMEKIQPTQFSASYRSALSDYVKRASGRIKQDDLLFNGSQRQHLSPNSHLQPFPFFHVSSTSESKTSDEDSIKNNEAKSDDDEEDYSSSFDNEDD